MALAALSLPVLAPRALHAATADRTFLDVDRGIQVSAVLERPSTPPFTERPAQFIRVAPGDTLTRLAGAFHTDAATLRWANAIPDLSEPRPGSQLLVPPGHGVLVRLQRAERPSEVATAYGLDPRVILDYNVIADDTPLRGGSWVQVPKAAAPPGALDSAVVVPSARGIPAVPPTQAAVGHDLFPWGQCTYYVATRRNVTWVGNAWTWFANARSAGRPVGQFPVAGAIMVSWDSWVGHVAYVERVNTDGSFVVSEMNVRGLGVVDQRTLSPGRGIIGFIY